MPQICRRVFTDAGIPAERFDWGGIEEGRYEPRVYCVQYDESEWDFVCRLLEDEGIWFAFEHAAEGHRMVFGDDSRKAKTSEPGELRTDFGQLGFTGVRAWGQRTAARLAEAKVHLDDYDGLRPEQVLAAEASGPAASEREWYEYPGGYETKATGQRRAQVRLEELRRTQTLTRVCTNGLFVQAGQRVLLNGYAEGRPDVFVVRTDLQLSLAAGSKRCEVVLETTPDDRVYRPPRRTGKPRVYGVQTARVTGPKGQEIHVDEYGRIKLQFDWDLDGVMDENTSCWIRVTQPYTTSSIALPRVGWEMVVEFVEGDPDRPVCRGRMMNPFFPPHFDLPAQKTVTALRTTSLPGADGINQLVYDDAAGDEQIKLHAERDLNVRVEHDRTESIGKQATHAVGKARSFAVGANETRTVLGSESVSVGRSQKTSASLRSVAVSGNASEGVKGSVTRTIAALSMGTHSMGAKAKLEKVKERKIKVEEGQKAEAAKRKVSPLLGAIEPALKIARQAMGGASLTGPGSGLLAGGEAAEAALSVEGADLSAPEVGEALDDSAALGASARAGTLAKEPNEKKSKKKSAKGGPGNWGVTVGGNLVETVGAAILITSGGAYSWSCSGMAVDVCGGIRIRAFGSGSASKSGGNVKETNGQTLTIAMESSKAEAKKGAQVNVAGVLRQKIKGSQVVKVQGAVTMQAPRAKLEAKESVSVVCGKSKLTVDDAGVVIEGKEIVIEGTQVRVGGAAIESA